MPLLGGSQDESKEDMAPVLDASRDCQAGLDERSWQRGRNKRTVELREASDPSPRNKDALLC